MKEYKEFNEEGMVTFEGYLDENEKLNGPAKYFHDFGYVSSEGNYKDGKEEGLWKSYRFKNLLAERNYKEGKLDGPSKEYNIDGQLEKEGQYIAGQKEGLWKYYNPEGLVVQEKYYKVGQEINSYELKYWEDNKQISSITEIKNNKKDGLFKSFYDEKQISIEGTYKNDKEHGEWKSYYPNGQLERERTYKEGKLDGPYKSYHENGQLEKEGQYIAGQRDGAWIFYHENGQLEKEKNYKAGKEEGLWRAYYETGQLKKIENYHDEKLDGPYKSYHENGQLASEGQYKNDEREGTWKFYNEAGNLEKEVNYNEQKAELELKNKLNKLKELENQIEQTKFELNERELDHYYADSWEQSSQISDDISDMKIELFELKEYFKENLEKLDDFEKINYLKSNINKENDLIKDEILNSLENKKILSKSDNLEKDIQLAEVKILSNLISKKENERMSLEFDNYIEFGNNDIVKVYDELKKLKEEFVEKFTELSKNEKLNLLEENIKNYHIKQIILDISEMENILPNREFINKENIDFINASLKNETLDKTELNFILSGYLEKDELSKFEELYQKGINIEQLEVVKNEVDKEKRDILFKVAEKDISTDKFKEIADIKENDTKSFEKIAYELRNNYLYNNSSINLAPLKNEITKENIENWLKTNPDFKNKGNFEIKRAIRDENRYGCIEANSSLLSDKIKQYLKENNLENDFKVKMKVGNDSINIQIEKKYNLEKKIQEEIEKNKPKTFLEKIKNLINPKEINIDDIKNKLNEKYRNIEKVIINESSKLYKIENIKSFDKELNNIAKDNLKEIEKIRENIIPYKTGVEIKVNSWNKREKTQNRGWGARAFQKSGLGHGE